MKVIDRAAVEAALADGQPVRILEALPPKYFNEGHLPGAKQLDFQNAVAHAARLHVAKTDRVIVYCASDTCANSHEAAKALIEAGFTNVAVYADGKKDWVEAGLSLEGIRDAA
jgi:rhodanese-related sulfurtransferase